MTLSIITLSISTLNLMTLSVFLLRFSYGGVTIQSAMVSVIMLGVVMLSTTIKSLVPSFIMLCAVLLSITIKSVMLSAIMLGAVMLIILWYYFTSWKEDPPYMEPHLLRQNLGAKTIWVNLTLKTTPPPLFLDPIHLSGSALFLYYISSHYSINKLLRNLTPFRQHVLLLYAEYHN